MIKHKIKSVVLGLLFGIIFFSCEDVVDVDVPQTLSILSIDALVRLDLSQSNTTIQIKASLSSSFFGELKPASLTSITIINSSYVPTSVLDQNIMYLAEVSPGIYEGTKSTGFFTEGELQLNIEHNGQNYRANTQFAPTTPILKIEQGDGTLFTGNETEIKVTFVDNGDRNDYYLVDLDFGEYLVTEDTFYQGQTFRFSYFYDDGVKSGREINISLLGVNESFYNYMNQLIVQANGDQGPFQTPAATVRGNLINVSDIDNVDTNNFALGYFAVCQTFTETIIIE